MTIERKQRRVREAHADSAPANMLDVALPGEPFLNEVADLGLELDACDLERLQRFLQLLLTRNQTTNLTAITEPSQAWRRHILDALTLIPVLSSLEHPDSDSKKSPTEPAACLRVADVGSGGGVPALPLAIVMPQARFTLIEATAKKAAFLRQAAQQLELENVRVLNERAETVSAWGTPGGRTEREQYDAAMARALGHLAIVCELCAPLIKPGGVLIAVKGAKAEQEIDESKKALAWLGLAHVQTLQTPTGRLVILEKTTRTPRTYPRKVGEPARVPLGVEQRRA